MGNLSFMVPTNNLKVFTFNKITEMLEQEFPEFTFEKNEEHYQLDIRTKNDVLVTTIYFNSDCYILDYDETIEMLKNPETHANSPKELILKLKILRQFDPDLHNCLALTYGTGMFVDDKFRVERFLMKQFNGYLFDEGIHPEFQTFEEID